MKNAYGKVCGFNTPLSNTTMTVRINIRVSPDENIVMVRVNVGL